MSSAETRGITQELRDEAERAAADVEHGAWHGRDDVDGAAGMGDVDMAGCRPVIAVEDAQQAGFACTGRAGQHQRLSGRDAEIDGVEDGQPNAALIVQGEGLGDVLDVNHRAGGVTRV